MGFILTQDFKTAYAPQWEHTKYREKYIRALLELFRYVVDTYDETVESDRFFLDPKPEIGAPEFKVWYDEKRTVLICYVEVTGTETLPRDDPTGWIRWDKVRWATNHQEARTFCAHITEDQGAKIRWILGIDAGKYQIREVDLGYGPERYHPVPLNQFMTTKQFLEALKGRKK